MHFLKKIKLVTLLLVVTGSLGWSQRTTIHGVVRDSVSDEKLAYATVMLEGANVGTRTDAKGNFFIETDRQITQIKVTYVGYTPRVVAITEGQHNELQVTLTETNLRLGEVSIRPEKYRRKNNPAVDLVAEVFRHKDQNRKEGLDFYSYEQYEKLQMDLNGITDGYRKKWYFRPFRFIFDHVDTNKVTQKVAFPFYMRERVTRSYYRKDPRGRKAILVGERQTGFHDEESDSDDLGLNGEGVSAYLNSTFTDIDIYEPKFQLFGTEFVGPLSGIANAVYRFYIEDTLTIDGRQYADVFFAPINKSDLAFMGNMLVALDSTYAVMKVEMGISSQVNLNWVSDMRIEQQFARLGDGPTARLMVTHESFIADFKILKNAKGRSLLIRKNTNYRGFDLVQSPHDSLFNNKILVEKDTGAVTKRPVPWWEARRDQPLTRSELYIEKMVDSIQTVPIFKFMRGWGELMSTGYHRVGFFDFGRVSSFYSFNGVEGNRFRVGGRTNSKLYKPLWLGGYVAYGDRDRAWKYQAFGTLAFNGKVPRSFPQHQMTILYQKDLQIPGFALSGLAQDNLAVSVQRGANNRMLWTETHRVEYKREFKNQLSFTTMAQRKSIGSAGVLLFERADETPAEPDYANSLVTSEVGLFVRYAPNQQFYNGVNGRTAIAGKFPVLSLTARAGFRGVAGGQYSFQKIQINVEKRVFAAPFGITDLRLQAGRIWGTVPYPLLEVHAANQSYFNDVYAYNLMNYMEFVSDKYVALNVQHNFKGFFFNKIPLIRRLNLREILGCKVLYGGLDQRNWPANNPDLYFFPKDENGTTLTRPWGRQPYIETNVGISNLFGFLRVDYIWRLQYLQQPDATRWGIRFMFIPGF
jgi:hypothetical protein